MGVKAFNYAQFFDDAILIGGACFQVATRFKSILDMFLDSSRGKVNKEK